MSMEDLKIMIDAAKQLNRVWSTCSNGLDKEDDGSEFYYAMCEIDEAIINLVEKISLCVKAKAVNAMYGNSVLAATHESIVKRYKG